MEKHFSPSENRKTINWAHGTSTELFIYPSNGDFLSRDFTFRISTATVEADETTFSSFPSITRTLMILEGNLTLIHEGRYTKELKTFEQDTFMGDWDTRSKGRVRDFNLMCKNGARGNVSHKSMLLTEHISLDPEGNYQFFFVTKGEFNISDTALKKGDTLVIANSEDVKIKCIESGDLIHGAVWL